MFVRQDGPNLEVLAPAKINLFLEVTGKRSDGFHELDMLMVPVALFDRLTLALAEDSDIHLSTSWALGLQSQPELPSPEENLVYHILSMFQDVVQQLRQDRPGICVKLVKRIPMAAGLGGASSDAAAALVAANQLLDNLLSFDQLFDIAVQTGSDVPFFLYRRPARCQGRGEIVMPVSSGQSLPVVLVKPEQGLSTPAVFSRLAEYGFDDTEGIAPMLAAFAAGDPSLVGARLHNRLLQPALGELPALAYLSRRLEQLDIPGYQMTGSGSTFFVICRHQTQANKLASRLRQMRLGTVLDTYTIDQPFGWAA
tara:strand:- start:695 stop:1627 length:933 start_codon:yes stop_codon:yes gene_type:complete